jgi:hypothetical protein
MPVEYDWTSIHVNRGTITPNDSVQHCKFRLVQNDVLVHPRWARSYDTLPTRSSPYQQATRTCSPGPATHSAYSRKPATTRRVSGLPQQESPALAQRHLPHVSAQHITHGKARATTLGLDPLAPEYRGPREQHEPNPAPA